jgi:putative DNA methylase
VSDAREQIYADTLAAGLPDEDVLLREGGAGARVYAEAVSVYLAFAVDKMTDTNSTLCTWQNRPPRLRATFGRQALPMTWDFAEANIFGDAAGDYQRTTESLCKVLDQLSSSHLGRATQLDVTISAGDLGDVIVSIDPPYYDNIGYADLSDFFYVWLRRNLRSAYDNIFSTLLVPKEQELVATPYRFGDNKDAANRHFENGLARAFVNIRHVVARENPLTVFYAFKQSETEGDENEVSGQVVSSTGWETMLEGVIRAGFEIDGTWPIRTELRTRNVGRDANALASSIILVCRPRPDDAPTISRREFVNALRREMPAALRELQSGNIAPVDLAQASIGPGMAVYSRYRKVLEANGEALSVRTALQLINQELDAYLAEQEGDVDADTRFAVNWFEQYGFREGEFGVADVLARAKNTSVEGVANAGVVVAGGGKVRLLSWEEIRPDWDPSTDRRPTVWEAVHHLIERINTHGESGAAALLLKMKADVAAEAHTLAYRLYSVCERKGWADIARDYNALVVSWPRLQELANELRQNQPPEQVGLF